MPLLNYTTTIRAEKTASEIMTILAKAGATQILADYREGRPVGLAFSLTTPTGVCQYQLPVDANPVHGVLNRQRVSPKYATKEQAEKVAWRILKDWVEAQLAIIETKMVAVDQVFLPYMLTPEGTIYQMYLDQQLALGSGPAQ